MKPKREITLGEMQDECEKTAHCSNCVYRNYCPAMSDIPPNEFDLTDPPRFTEAQMAFWRCLYEVGVKYVFRAIKWICLSDDENPEYAPVANLGTINISAVHDCMKLGETLDLAELFGKEGTK